MSNCCAHHWIHSVLLCWEGSGVKVHWRLPPAPTLAKGISSPKNSGNRGWEGAGTQDHPLLEWLLVWNSQIGYLLPLCPPRYAGEALWHWHPSQGYFQPMTESRLPTIMIKKGWVTELTFLLTPLGVTPPGEFWLNDLQSRIFSNGCPSACSFLSIGNHSWEQLKLSILSSRSTAAADACQWASLAMANASSQEPHFISLNLS